MRTKHIISVRSKKKGTTIQMSEYGSPRKHIDALIQQLIAATNDKEIQGILDEIGEFFDRDGYADVTTRAEKRALNNLSFFGPPMQQKEKFLKDLGKSATQSPEAPPPAPAPKSPEAPPKKGFVQRLRDEVRAARETGGRRKTQRRKSKKQLTKKRRTVKRV